MDIYIDGELPKSCASCEFLVHCDECEGHENYCPIIREQVGYDISDSLIDGAPVTFVTKRHRHCTLKQRPHGEWIPCKDDNFCKCSECKQIVMSEERSNFCPNCGADMRTKGGDE